MKMLAEIFNYYNANSVFLRDGGFWGILVLNGHFVVIFCEWIGWRNDEFVLKFFFDG
jgi:hypothetical protein